MTIEEKAKEYADYNMAFSQDIIANELTSGYSDFIAGARWMLEKTISGLNNKVIFDEVGRPVKIEQFKKAMEE